VRLERIAWPESDPPAESRLRVTLASEGFDVFRWHDEPGARYTAHHHDHDESLWVVAGEITFGAAGQELRLAAGDRLMLPAGTVHTARVGGAGATYLIGQRR
jgi:quercetin dioxygenase-like cupin family protein